jgi:serine/threonine-protein kinase
MGVVYRAVDTVLDREVALKELRVPESLDRREAVDRFLTEARAAAGLSHPSIVTVHDVFAEADRVLMSMELLEGQTLAQVLDTHGGLGDAARPVMTDVAAALATAHNAGIVHRDLKPDNIFLLPTGRVVVCDFGLARIGSGRGTQIGTIMGTPGYMAPEQLRGHDVGPPADVFAWGAVAHELATGTPAFGNPDDDPVALSYRVTHEHPPTLEFHTDPDFGPIIDTALAKNPDHRYPTGAHLHHALTTGHSTTNPGRQPTPPHRRTPSAPPRQPHRRTPLAPIAIAGAVVIAALILGITLLTGHHDKTSFTNVATTTPNPTTPTTTAAAAAAPLKITSIGASSRAPDGLDASGHTISYNETNAVDGLTETAWRVPGNGVGTVLTIANSGGSRITRVGLLPGYAKIDDTDGTNRFTQNRRVVSVRWTFRDGSSVVQSFQDAPRLQMIDVDAPAGPVALEILSSTAHGGRDFTAISEIQLWGR